VLKLIVTRLSLLPAEPRILSARLKMRQSEVLLLTLVSESPRLTESCDESGKDSGCMPPADRVTNNGLSMSAMIDIGSRGRIPYRHPAKGDAWIMKFYEKQLKSKDPVHTRL
jgi:hypothetical protein